MGKVRIEKKGRTVAHPYTTKPELKVAVNPKNKKKKTDSSKPSILSTIKSLTAPRNKKEKLKQRREQWKEKMNTLKNERDAKKAQQCREKTRITGDLQPLSAELTSILSGIMADKKINLNMKPFKPEKPYNPLMSNVDQFRSVLQNKQFKKDPLATVKKHVLLANSLNNG